MIVTSDIHTNELHYRIFLCCVTKFARGANPENTGPVQDAGSSYGDPRTRARQISLTHEAP